MVLRSFRLIQGKPAVMGGRAKPPRSPLRCGVVLDLICGAASSFPLFILLLVGFRDYSFLVSDLLVSFCSLESLGVWFRLESAVPVDVSVFHPSTHDASRGA